MAEPSGMRKCECVLVSVCVRVSACMSMCLQAAQPLQNCRRKGNELGRKKQPRKYLGDNMEMSFIFFQLFCTYN